jgi:hypothetical protein
MFTSKQLYEWCRIPCNQLENHPDRKIPFRLCKDSAQMSQMMARELVDKIRVHNERGQATAAFARGMPNYATHPPRSPVAQPVTAWLSQETR